MEPNPQKCEVVVYNDPEWPHIKWLLNGTPLERSKEFRYLKGTFYRGTCDEGRAYDASMVKSERERVAGSLCCS
jgi:hypothetical protein